MGMMTYLVPSTRKVFCDEAPRAPYIDSVRGFQNERMSFQLCCELTDKDQRRAMAEISLSVDCALPTRVRLVTDVPVHMGNYYDDGDYLRGGRPGLYPDMLEELPQKGIRVTWGLMRVFWIDITPCGAKSGDYPLTVSVRNAGTGETLAENTVTCHVLPGCLPSQKLIHTRWMHTDCLATWYQVPVFSEEYWRITQQYVRCAAQHGVNMLLTPIHTPPLDTRVGTERPTVQLVDVYLENGEYRFGFDKLRRWVEMAKGCGIEYFEMAHLFSQWGAKCAVKIVARVDGEEKRIFGWDTPANDPEYARFLDAYLGALTEELTRLGIDKHTYFHISDEPNEGSMEQYLADKALVEKRLQGYPIMDALSNLAFYQKGVVKKPVPSIDHIEPFIEEGVEGLWGYYCCGQHDGVPNVFIAMPGYRTRVLGPMLYKFQIEGFLQWGFNFYYSVLSDYLANPFLNTDWMASAPAGDAFLVYPGRAGEPVESIRLMLVEEAMQDLRAMQLLESLAGREAVLRLIDEGLNTPLRFGQYPREEGYILALREKIDREIVKRKV